MTGGKSSIESCMEKCMMMQVEKIKSEAEKLAQLYKDTGVTVFVELDSSSCTFSPSTIVRIGDKEYYPEDLDEAREIVEKIEDLATELAGEFMSFLDDETVIEAGNVKVIVSII